MKIDEVDFRILELINENPKMSYRNIAKHTNITTPTAIQRILKLEKNKIIMGYYTILNSRLLSIYKDIYILKFIPKNNKLLQKLKRIDNVKRIMKLNENRFLIFYVYKYINETIDFMNFLEKNKIQYEKLTVLDEIKTKNEILIMEHIKRLICDYCGGNIQGNVFIKRINGEEKHFCCNTCKNDYVKRFKKLKSYQKLGSN